MKILLPRLYFCVLIILVSSCGKEESETGIINLNDRVKTYTEKVVSDDGNSVITFNLNYDAKGRLTDLTSVSNPGDKFLFSYPSDNKYSMDLYNSGRLSIHEDFFFRNSRVDSTFQYTSEQDTTTEKYIYDGNDRLALLKQYEYDSGPQLINTTNFTYDSNGNLSASTDTDLNTDTYEYYADLVYTMPVIMPVLIQPKKANLVKTHTVKSNGYLVGTTTSTYTFDANNRVSTIVETLDNDNFVTKTFTYY